MSKLNAYLEQTPKDAWNKKAIAFFASWDSIYEENPTIAHAIFQELKDQKQKLKLIASENFSSLPVQLAMGNFLTDKYAEGYAHHRFYAGCDNVDTIEAFASNSAKTLFNAEYANVQPHSGADANLLAFWAILTQRIQNKEVEKLNKKNLNDITEEDYQKIRELLIHQKMLGLSLNSGGHLTHGYRHNISSKMMHSVFYDVDPTTERIDYKALEKKALEEKPLILLAGYSAHPCKLNFAKMKEIADKCGATLLVDMAHFAGLVAGGAFEGEYNPIPYGDIVTSTTHKTLRGPRGGLVLAKKTFEDTLNKGCPLVMGGPLPHVMAAKALAFEEAKAPSFKTYAHKIIENSQALAKALQAKGLRLVSGGTENHMVIFEVSSFGLTGLQAEAALRNAYLTVNRNSIPFDKNGPWLTSGIRVGTPALTTLGMGTSEMEKIAELIFEVLSHTKPIEESRSKTETAPDVVERARNEVSRLLTEYPLYPELDINIESRCSSFC